MSEVRIVDHGENRTMTLAQLAAAVGGGGGGGSPARTQQTVTYRTPAASPSVHLTILSTSSVVLVARTTSGISLVTGQSDMYKAVVDVTGLSDFLAVWDDGNVNDYVIEWVVVDT